MQPLASKLLNRIRGKGGGFAFTAKDFLDLGNRGAVDMALSTLAKSGQIRRISRGVYDYPSHSKLLGGLQAPNFDQVAHAIARKTGIRIQPSGALAANLLGLSEQVPAKLLYITDGPSRVARVGNQRIILKHQTKRNLVGLGRQTGLVFQALRYLGKDNITDAVIQKLQSALTDQQKRSLRRDATRAADWARECVAKITTAA